MLLELGLSGWQRPYQNVLRTIKNVRRTIEDQPGAIIILMPYQDYHRRSIRLPDYDYRQAGAFFVTIVSYQREELFGSIKDQQVCLNTLGQAAASYWQCLPDHFPIQLDESILMPNHIHAILFLLPENPPDNHLSQAGSLGAILQNFKSVTTQNINKIRRTPGQPVWQRNYYEHIIRNQEDLEAIRQYIEDNPVRDDGSI